MLGHLSSESCKPHCEQAEDDSQRLTRWLSSGNTEMLAWQPSTTNVYHSSVLILGNLKHASVSSLLPVDCSRNDDTQIII